jgi:hypothetical protein
MEAETARQLLTRKAEIVRLGNWKNRLQSSLERMLQSTLDEVDDLFLE